MCADHTYCGTPVSQMPLEAILKILGDDGAIDNQTNKPLSPENWFWIRLRLEVEIHRRAMGYPLHNSLCHP